jgi:hypothetical protein
MMNRTTTRALYIGFVMLGLYYLAFAHRTADAIPVLGIALAFDPFDPAISFKQRPSLQRGVLYLHLTVVLLLVAGELSGLSR